MNNIIDDKNKLAKIKQALKKDSIFIYFLPSAHLKEIVSKGEHPYVKNMPDCRKAEILSGMGIMIQKRMVWEWLEQKLDDKNAWILSQGEIRVLGSESLINKKKVSEDF